MKVIMYRELYVKSLDTYHGGGRADNEITPPLQQKQGQAWPNTDHTVHTLKDTACCLNQTAPCAVMWDPTRKVSQSLFFTMWQVD
jgi:hypothetical protein